jgi:hypothetical protein
MSCPEGYDCWPGRISGYALTPASDADTLASFARLIPPPLRRAMPRTGFQLIVTRDIQRPGLRLLIVAEPGSASSRKRPKKNRRTWHSGPSLLMPCMSLSRTGCAYPFGPFPTSGQALKAETRHRRRRKCTFENCGIALIDRLVLSALQAGSGTRP